MLFRSFFLGLFALALSFSFVSANAQPRETGPVSGLPMPRFVSLNADKVNVRTGPGSRYPIAWQFQRKGWPVEVVAEFELWLKIRDNDGAEGWVRKNLVTGRRSALIAGRGLQPILRRPDAQAELSAQAEPGVMVQLLSCKDDWCQIGINTPAGARKGFVRRAQLWGVYGDETVE